MKDIYIGIDYSLKSPAICIIKNDICKWISHPKKLEKKELERQEIVGKLPDVTLIFQDDLEVDTIYSKNEYLKLLHNKTYAEKLITLIRNELTIDDLKCTAHFALEGFSFGSHSNNLIDIVAATTTFKLAIINSNLFMNYTLDVFSPKSIKKFAGYGSYDKGDLLDVFIGNYDYIKPKYAVSIAKDKKGNINLEYSDPKLECSGLNDYCRNMIINRNVKKIKIAKPIDDLIDAYLIANMLVDEFEA